MLQLSKPLILSNCKYSVQMKRGEQGIIDGITFIVNDEIVVRYDLSRNYEIKGSLLTVKLEEQYEPEKYSDHQVGLKDMAESYISSRIIEANVGSDMVLSGWEDYENVIPLGQIAKFLIGRDVLLARLAEPNYFLPTPSWDVCISLAMYFKLCENIDGFAEKLKVATDIGDQIRGNWHRLDKDIRAGKYSSGYLENLLRSMHSLNDELELAYAVHKIGYEIRFGSRGEPDYFINGVPVEQKSRFPEVEHLFEKVDKAVPSKFRYAEAIGELVSEIKGRRKALKKAEVFFYNLSRVIEGSKFFMGTQIEKMGPQANSFNFADMFDNFDVMMKSVFIFLGKGKIIVPYVKPLSINPKIVCFFPIPE
ncbi:hypothetical protein M1O14_03235, partial [Dehalococcoidia bacterium]|nr:hypothetical protein [Dehalococcoidia bacterium]